MEFRNTQLPNVFAIFPGIFNGLTEAPPPLPEKAVKGLRGFDFEVATAAFELLGYEVDIEFLPWKRALAYARLGKVAGILTCAYTKERAEFMAFSDPISVFINGFYARKGHNETAPALIEDV